MFNRKSKAIVPYSSDNNTIKPSISAIKNLSNKITSDPDSNLSIDILNEMRNTQVISNYEFMELSSLKEILLKLNKIEVNTAQTAVSTEFTGRYIVNKFHWV